MAFHVWKKALGCTTFQPHWKAFFNPKAPLLAQKNDALRLVVTGLLGLAQRVFGLLRQTLEERSVVDVAHPEVRLACCFFAEVFEPVIEHGSLRFPFRRR